MLSILWQLITGNRLVRLIGGALAAVLGILTFGALKKREGRQAAKSEAAAAKAKAEAKGDAAVVESRRGGLTWQERLKRNRGGK
jgi:hypothetical protein